jgi:glycosyltransferase involved in cell wall biosynthesis
LTQQFRQHAVIANEQERGLSGGRNTGIAASSGKLIAFLDDDATADPHWLAYLTAHCVRPEVLGAGSRVEPAWADPKPRWFPEEFLWVVGCSYRGMPRVTTPVRNLMGGCMCVRREIFEAVGGFHSKLGRGAGNVLLSCEETELCIRANQHFRGRAFVYEPAAFIRHRVPASRVTWKYLSSRCYAEGRSKALVATLAGSRQGLSMERRYALKVLPRGVGRGIADFVLRADPWGLARAFAIGLGFGMTVCGYLTGRYRLFGPDRLVAETAK